MSRAVLSSFEEFQKERVKFVQTIAELARKKENVEALQAAGIPSYSLIANRSDGIIEAIIAR